MEIGQILHIKEYNRLGEIKWKKACNKKLKEVGMFAYMHGHQPNLCFYTWDKNYGYVYKTDYGSIWGKTKKELLEIKNK